MKPGPNELAHRGDKRREEESPVTPEMIEAGLEGYYSVPSYPGDYGVSEEELVAIYRAMKAAEASQS